MTSRRRWGTAVIGLSVAYLVVSGNRGLWNLYKLHKEKQAHIAQITRLKSDINRVQAEYRIFEKDAAVMEKQAREELNLIKPVEMVYKFTRDENP